MQKHLSHKVLLTLRLHWLSVSKWLKFSSNCNRVEPLYSVWTNLIISTQYPVLCFHRWLHLIRVRMLSASSTQWWVSSLVTSKSWRSKHRNSKQSCWRSKWRTRLWKMRKWKLKTCWFSWLDQLIIKTRLMKAVVKSNDLWAPSEPRIL